MSSNPPCADALRRFAQSALSERNLAIEPASADASFRSYWRIRDARRTTVAMDAPPDKENIEPWLDVGARLVRAGLHAPAVYAADCEQGFVLMEDLGTRMFLDELNATTVDALYSQALDALLRMQTSVDPAGLPAFDEAFMTTELELMPEWFLRRHLGHAIDCDEWDVIELAFRTLISALRAQPQAFMHRDYHSRNLLVIDEAGASRAKSSDSDANIARPLLASPGIIDFQGAMIGPVAYDLASLLRDCYIAWDAERVEGWMENYHQRLRHAHLIDTHVDIALFRRWFDLAGLQRHIKVLGIFCRLWYRDGKAHYLSDLPLTWRYVISVARRYVELAPLADLLERALGERDITQPRGEALAG
ncbi:MAG TPA: phosphotransferase [Rhodanobacteraceae bacterium]|jgi:aminoglycoside/choline kinase family phosphotransferase|nr:phosphotransferase [Rhodanobacteraceae bacterium]